MSEFSLITYNIHKGLNLGNRKFILDKIKDKLHKNDPDFILLQEIHGSHESRVIPDNPETSHLNFLADDTYLYNVYGKNAVYKEGDHGNALLSKWPILDWKNINLSTNNWEHRGLLMVKLDYKVGEHFLHIACCHLNLLEKGRQKQINSICDYIQDEVDDNTPLILAGDFNDWREKLSVKLRQRLGLQEAFLKSQGNHAKTFPSFRPSLKLDRVYFRHLSLMEAAVLDSKEWGELSDHSPLSVRFKN